MAFHTLTLIPEKNRLQVTIDVIEAMNEKVNAQAGQIRPAAAASAFKDAWKTVTSHITDTLSQFNIDLSPSKGKDSSGSVATPADPLEALEKIAAAINKAETTLNKQNLIIAGGRVEASIDVNVGGAAAAHSTIVFNITPNPYGSTSDNK